jgi:drug/metabolite transporter (DMT)-like permease/predicted RNA-binding protein with PIN domain
MSVARPLTGRTVLGYALVVSAVTLWSLNASVARTLLDDGVSALRLSELRALGSWLLLVALVAAFRPSLLRVERAEVPHLAFLGIAGFALVYATYFVAIERLQIGVALTLEYLAPLLLLLYLWLGRGRRLSRALWGAMALSLAGCFLVVRAYQPGSLDALGLAAGLGSAVSYAIYLAGSERAGRRHAPATTLVWGFGFATLFWLCVQPPWTFPFSELEGARNVLLAVFVVVIGTLVPFGCMVAALRHVPAARAAIVATLEPVLSALFAFLIHDEGLAAVQIAGGLIVLGGVVWVQRQRPDLAAESVSGGEIARPEPLPAEPAVRWLVDGLNVIGSRPDGWWRDRHGAMRRLTTQLGKLASLTGEEVSVVFDGREPQDPPHAPAVAVSFAPGGRGSADDRIAETVAADADPSSLRVVTSDRELTDRVRAAGAEVVRARSFRNRLDELDEG